MVAGDQPRHLRAVRPQRAQHRRRARALAGCPALQPGGPLPCLVSFRTLHGLAKLLREWQAQISVRAHGRSRACKRGPHQGAEGERGGSGWVWGQLAAPTCQNWAWSEAYTPGERRGPRQAVPRTAARRTTPACSREAALGLAPLTPPRRRPPACVRGSWACAVRRWGGMQRTLSGRVIAATCGGPPPTHSPPAIQSAASRASVPCAAVTPAAPSPLAPVSQPTGGKL